MKSRLPVCLSWLSLSIRSIAWPIVALVVGCSPALYSPGAAWARSAPQTVAAPAASTIPAVASTDRPEIRELQKVEDAWSAAVNTRDQYGLELVLSPLFVDVSPTGDVTTRDQQIIRLINDRDKGATLDQHVVTVRILGDVAVANGTYTLRHKVQSGMVEDKGIFTHVFERVHGNWVCINSQRTTIREIAPQDKQKTSKKSSDAELPFHFPLFQKSDKNNQ